MEGEISITCKQWNGSFNPFSFSLTFGNLSGTVREKT